MRSVADLSQRLQELHLRTAETPLFNPVFQLSLDLSRLIESGELSLADCGAMIEDWNRRRCHTAPRTCAIWLPRWAKMRTARRWPRAFLKPISPLLPRAGSGRSCTPCSPRIRPSCSLPAETAAVAKAAATGTPIDPASLDRSRPKVTLAYEHAEAMKAIAHAQEARDVLVRAVLGHAARTWPDRWQELAPLPFRFASWVGYDMDGRTDITWSPRSGSGWRRRPSGWRSIAGSFRPSIRPSAAERTEARR
jgi:phosphoenolpyruvate carboxylase